MEVRTNLNPWAALQGLTKNPVDNLVEDGRWSTQPGRTPWRQQFRGHSVSNQFSVPTEMNAEAKF